MIASNTVPVDVAHQQALFESFRQVLHQGGAFAHYVVDSAKCHPETGRPYQQAIWFRIESAKPLPDGKQKVFYTVSPCFQIPPTNAKGKRPAPQWRHSQNEYIGAVNCLYAEFDDKDFGDDHAATWDHIEQLPDTVGAPFPSVVSDSGGGYQAYWLLDSTFLVETDEDRGWISQVQEAWVHLVSGDPGVHDLRRILRVPGTWNMKEAYGPDGRLCHFVHYELTRRFSLDDLAELLPEPEPEPDYAALHAYAERTRHVDYDRDVIARYVDDVLDEEYHTLAYRTQGGRSAALVVSAMKLGGILKADWSQGYLTEGTIHSELMRAAEQNGLVSDYGRDEIKRQVDNGIRQASAWIKPNLRKRYPEYFENTNGHHPMTQPSEPPPPPPVDPPPSPMNQLQFETSDEGNAEAVAAVHGHRFRFVDAWGWLHYTGTHWERAGAEAALGFAVVETFRERCHQAINAELEKLVKKAWPDSSRITPCIKLLRKHARAEPEDFDRHRHLLNVANGVLNLRTGKLLPHTPDQYFTYCVPIPYKENADCSDWITFLYETVEGGAEVIEYMQEAVGYSLTGETREECLFYIHGETRSGKGTFATTVMELLGEPLAMGVDFGTFASQYGNASPDAQNFALAPLKPARFLVASESGKYHSLNEAKVKQLTGGDKIQASFKGKDHFYYYPQFKVWLLSNHPPRGDVDDDALWNSRIKVIRFPWSKLGAEDKTLKSRLQSPDNLIGVLMWAVEGARRWYEREQGLQAPSAVVKATEKARSELDTVQQWMDECCTPAEDAFTANSLLQASYGEWCKENGYKPLGGRNLGLSLSKKGYSSTTQRVSGAVKRGIVGLQIVSGDKAPIVF